MNFESMIFCLGPFFGIAIHARLYNKFVLVHAKDRICWNQLTIWLLG